MAGNFYELLEVDRDASRSDIRGAYREKARRYHPDVNDDPRARDQFATLNKAREVLTSPKERDRYDRLGHHDYVGQHLDGLPTMSRPGESEAAEGTTTDSANDSSTDSSTGSATDPSTGSATDRETGSATGSPTDSTTGSANDTTTGTATGSASGRGAGIGGSGGPGSPGGSHGTGVSSASSSGTGAGTGSAAGSGSGSAGQTDAAASGSAADSGGFDGSSRSRRSRRSGGTATTSTSSHRRGLQRGWNASVTAFTLYLVGLGGYAMTARGGIREAFAALGADPIAAVGGTSPLQEPATVVRLAAADVGAGLVTAEALAGVLFAVGLLTLPLAIGVTVAKYGRGGAYLYVAAVAIPVAWTVTRPAISAPLAADVLALAVVPLVGGAWFLVDIGRYLRSA